MSAMKSDNKEKKWLNPDHTEPGRDISKGTISRSSHFSLWIVEELC